ncbi:cytochrome P450 [Dichomitus squalens LYAD-421 SS1]|uniref:Cytochrome P450 n=1 Tax=Dichomitus squalens (strain LYAD-421) TaxID=732165 RepID=R7ST11_DICSQ|nr:cytochrome P450 [Dichomitus squalens LYAD-421 SS1]EJF59354.1 cytochrome P450 [Dichomitus squalens LYAD-421 SS1]
MEIPSLNAILAFLAVGGGFLFIRWRLNPLSRIPTVGGPSIPGLSILSTVNFLRNSKDLLVQGYEKYRGSTFKVALLDQWLVIVSGSELVDEVRKRPELSLATFLEDIFQMKHTLGPDALGDNFHVPIIRDQLTRSLGSALPEVIEELSIALPQCIPGTSSDWVSVNVSHVSQKLITRASSRIFVGQPLCRNEDYLKIALDFTMDVVNDRLTMSKMPDFLRTPVMSWTSSTRRSVARSIPLLKPIIDQRKALMEEYGADWTDKPKDVLQWVLDEAVPRNLSDERVAMRLHLVNFAAIHTSSNSLVHALYDLGAFPEYIQPIRDEIESIVAVDGWTKEGISKMSKLDSLLRESQRIHGISLISVTRKAMADVTLRDGTFLPKGTCVAAATWATHYDEGNFEKAAAFDAFRFSRMREAPGQGTKHQFVHTSVEYIPFGHGAHACPGRFFASNEIKAVLAFLLVNYDIQFEPGQSRPDNIFIAENILPNHDAKMLFRRRGTLELH